MEDTEDTAARSSPRPTRPLDGLLVLDLTLFLSGPFATQILAGLGARVIKIEQPGLGDPSRANPPYYGPRGIHSGRRDEGDLSLSVLKRNRNKESVTLNLKHDEGRAILRDLARQADVLVENFAPGVTARLGIDEPTLRAINPRLVYCSISGFGQEGPYRGPPAYDLVVQAMSGLMTSTGEPDGAPTRSAPRSPTWQAGCTGRSGSWRRCISANTTPKSTGSGWMWRCSTASSRWSSTRRLMCRSRAGHRHAPATAVPA